MSVKKVAIPVFGQRVSPRCDCASEILIAGIEDGEIVSRENLMVAGINEMQFLKLLVDRGVDTIIGGAVPGFYYRMAEGMGIRMIRVPCMPVEELLEIIKVHGAEAAEGHEMRRGGRHGCRMRRRRSGRGFLPE